MVNDEEKNIFIMEAINQESYSYFLPKEKFTPVVCLDDRFGHEWTANEEIRYSHYEKNNVEDIKGRNIVKVVDREKFKSQDNYFYERLNDPKAVINTLDNSGVLVEKNVLKNDRVAQLRGLVPTKAPHKPKIPDINSKNLDIVGYRKVSPAYFDK